MDKEEVEDKDKEEVEEKDNVTLWGGGKTQSQRGGQG